MYMRSGEEKYWKKVDRLKFDTETADVCLCKFEVVDTKVANFIGM